MKCRMAMSSWLRLFAVAAALGSSTASPRESPVDPIVMHLRSRAHAHTPQVEIQLALRTRFRAGAGSTSGFRVHRRHEHVHMWSEPCRHLPMEKRAACERKVDQQVLSDPTWVPLR